MSKDAKRSYGRLDKLDRKAIEKGVTKRLSAREIARGIGRSASSVTHEIKTNRTILSGGIRGALVEEVPVDACVRLHRFPYVCNGCNAYRFNCNRKFVLIYDANRANRLSDERRQASRMGVNRSEASFTLAMDVIKKDLRRGIAPSLIATQRADELGVSASTIYRWIDRGYCNMTNLELRKKVGYKLRKKKCVDKPSSFGLAHTYEAFLQLDEDVQATCVEMDTVIGLKSDTQCILTLYLRSFKFQFALLMPEKSPSAVSAALGLIEQAAGRELFSELFSTILTDRGTEFRNTALIEGVTHPKLHLFYCDAQQSHQKASCEKNHVELRKVLPKKQKISFDALSTHDLVTVMNHVNSQPRASLGWISPIKLMKTSLGVRIEPLFDALGIEEIPFEKLNLTKDLLFNQGGDKVQ